ncbi:MAG: HAMP domain-containing sensor histidine kinase [Oscillospiraceae bacterium]|nr:HAMP domain-containing sensor histidine kinase [Oscillospiraceae bacterium]
MGKIKQLFRDLSLRKSIALYIAVFAVIAIALIALTSELCYLAISRIEKNYPPSGNQYYLTTKGGEQLGEGIYIGTSPSDMSAEDRRSIIVLNTVSNVSVPIFSALCVIAAALLFYRNKLKKPLLILAAASDRISKNDLDFSVDYESRDEMGRLCGSFETMRAALVENNKSMWRAMEERRRLNAAFSHDLRTPLTVLRGYADFLKNYLPQGKVGEEKTISTVTTMSEQIERLENYVQMMSEAQKLEDITITLKEPEVCTVLEQLENTVQLVAQNAGLKFNFESELKEKQLCLDLPILLRIYENLIANAAQYAESTISVRIRYSAPLFTVTVSDDGEGFSDEDLKQAGKPYYRSQKADAGDTHFGLGLYLCRVLCRKHGGDISIKNGDHGGAKVSAKIYVKS